MTAQCKVREKQKWFLDYAEYIGLGYLVHGWSIYVGWNTIPTSQGSRQDFYLDN